MNNKQIFITGTDTEVGKTLVTAALTVALQNAGRSAIALKPVAAGCERQCGELRNDDALLLLETMCKAINPPPTYAEINPIALRNPLAPHIAARQEGQSLSVRTLLRACPLDKIRDKYTADTLLIEGAGGWLVPLNDTETFADYAVAAKLDVVLVVKMQLGCINHALLTRQAILASGLKLLGWVANGTPRPMTAYRENLATLKRVLEVPLIAEIPWLSGDDMARQASKWVRLDALT